MAKYVKTIGLKRVLNSLDMIPSASEKIVKKVLFAKATSIMNASQELVPVATGALKSSGTVSLPSVNNGRMTISIGYGGIAAPYALAVHENPRAGKTQGRTPSGSKLKRWSKVGQWKYLEIPFREHTEDIRNAIILSIKRELKNGIT